MARELTEYNCFQHGTLIILVQQYPIVRPSRNCDQEKVDRLNAILMQEVSRYKGEKNLVVWDSHINVINDWKALCLESNPGDFTTEEKREFRCDDWVHPGPIVMDHLADMLLNFICDH